VVTNFSEELAYPEDGGSRFLRNTGNILPDYPVPQLSELIPDELIFRVSERTVLRLCEPMTKQ
jgi:hypothetical protein